MRAYNLRKYGNYISFPVMPKRVYFNTTTYDDYFRWPFGKYCEHVVHTPHELRFLMQSKIQEISSEISDWESWEMKNKGIRKTEWVA